MWSRPYNVICTPETFGMWVHTYVGPIKLSFPLLSRKDIPEDVTNGCHFKIVMMSIGSVAGVGDTERYYRARARAEGEIHEGPGVQQDELMVGVQPKTPPMPSQHAHIFYIHRVGNGNAFPASISFRPTSSLACSTPLPKAIFSSCYHHHSRSSSRYPGAIPSAWSGCSWP